MFSTTRADAPRSGSGCSPSSVTGARRGRRVPRARVPASRRGGSGRRRGRDLGLAAGLVVGEELPPARGDRARVLPVQAVHLVDQARVGAQVLETVRSFGHHTFIVYHTGDFEPAPPHPTCVTRRRQATLSRRRFERFGSAFDELGDPEREVEGLAGVEARVAAGLVAVLELVALEIVAAAEAFGDVVAGQLDVHAARPDIFGVARIEETARLRA